MSDIVAKTQEIAEEVRNEIIEQIGEDGFDLENPSEDTLVWSTCEINYVILLGYIIFKSKYSTHLKGANEISRFLDCVFGKERGAEFLSLLAKNPVTDFEQEEIINSVKKDYDNPYSDDPSLNTPEIFDWSVKYLKDRLNQQQLGW